MFERVCVYVRVCFPLGVGKVLSHHCKIADERETGVESLMLVLTCKGDCAVFAIFRHVTNDSL